MSFPRLGAMLAAVGLLLSAAARGDEVAVFAAASTTDAMDEVGRAFTAKTGHTIRPSYAASSTLARQIEHGAPAHLFLSANEKWADYLEDRGLLVPGTRTRLLGNALVLIAAADSAAPDPKIEAGFDLAGGLRGGRLAVADPDHVPAGIYAREALTSLGAWAAVEPRLARMNDPRAAAALVARGEAPYGIVYATDAAAAGVRVAGTFPAASHTPVTYPVALVAGGDTPAARALLSFLASPEAAAVFRRHGFTVR